MAPISMPDYLRLADAAAAVVEGVEEQQSIDALTATVNECFRGMGTTYHGLLSPSAGTTMVFSESPAISDAPWPELIQKFSRHHPLAKLHVSGAGSKPLTVSDVMSDAEWRRNPCYEPIVTYLGGACWHLGISLGAPIGLINGFIVARADRDFSQHDRELARRITPLLRTAMSHLTVLDSLPPVRSDRQHPPEAKTLTPRERAVLQLVSGGLTSASIGSRLGLSIYTVNKHLENIYRKLDVNNRLSAVLSAQQLGLLTR
jgi:DNA-binding CsgD family transcriptional regulator